MARPSMASLGGGVATTWQPILEICKKASQPALRSQGTRRLELLQLLFLQAPSEIKPDILLEITALQIIRKDLREASTKLSSYVTEFPFSNSSLCHGYLGMVSLALWDQQYRHALCFNRAPSELPTNSLLPHHDADDEICELPEESGSASSAKLSALRAFERAVYNAPQNLMFVRYLVQLRLACDLAESALEAVNQYCQLCPDDPAGHRLYLDFSKQIDPDEEDLEEHLMTFQRLDPVSDTQVALNALLDRSSGDIDNSKGSQGQSSTLQVSEISIQNLEFLADRLDYGTPGVEERKTWLRLIQTIRTIRLVDVNARTGSERHVWEHRAEWWPKFHFYPVLRRKKQKRRERRIENQPIDEGQSEDVKELHDYKSIAAVLIFPEHFCSEDVSVALGRDRAARILQPYGLWPAHDSTMTPAPNTQAPLDEMGVDDEDEARKRRRLERKQNEREILKNTEFRFVRMDEEEEDA